MVSVQMELKNETTMSLHYPLTEDDQVLYILYNTF
jgi:hypothetical protein